MSKIFTRTFRVRWGELDPGGTVSPANYLRYLIETAWDWGTAVGWDANYSQNPDGPSGAHANGNRIIQVNSEGHRFGGLKLDDLHWEKRRYKGLQGYGASKTAQLLTVWELADRLHGSGVTINAVRPGEVATNIGMNNGFLYRWYQKHLLFPLLKDPKVSGEALYYFAAAPELSQTSGKFFNQTIEEKPAAHALDRVMGKRIWDISEEFTGLHHKINTLDNVSPIPVGNSGLTTVS